MHFANKYEKRKIIVLFLLPSMIGLIVFCYAPMIASFVYSFLDYDVLTPISEAPFIGLDNYIKLVTSGELWTVLGHTFLYLILYIPAIMLLSIGEAILINRSFKGNKLLRIIFYTPVITSWVAAAVVWRWVLSGKFSFVNQWLASIGIDAPAWLSNPKWAMFAIVIAALWKDTGFYALIVLAGLKGIDPNYYEAASIDGAKWYQKLFKITLPLLSPTIFLLLVYNIIGGLQVFDSVQIMTGGGPSGATTVMMERIYNYAFSMYKMGYATAWSWILFLIILIFTLVQFKMQKKWVNYDE